VSSLGSHPCGSHPVAEYRNYVSGVCWAPVRSLSGDCAHWSIGPSGKLLSPWQTEMTIAGADAQGVGATRATCPRRGLGTGCHVAFTVDANVDPAERRPYRTGRKFSSFQTSNCTTPST
jgi:hypothetical protein